MPKHDKPEPAERRYGCQLIAEDGSVEAEIRTALPLSPYRAYMALRARRKSPQ